MKLYVLAVCMFVSAPALSAIHCGSYTIQPDNYRITINGDLLHIVDVRFYGLPGNFRWATIKLLPNDITNTNRQYRLMTQGGNASLKVMTRENPPRVLNRMRCAAGLTGVDRYTPPL